MRKRSPFPDFIQTLRTTLAPFPDKRRGKNTPYPLVDAGLGAFAVFFTQSPSFLAYQRDMQARKGQSNAHTLFGLRQIPSDNQIRALRDPVSLPHLVPLFQHGLATLEETPQLAIR